MTLDLEVCYKKFYVSFLEDISDKFSASATSSCCEDA